MVCSQYCAGPCPTAGPWGGLTRVYSVCSFPLHWDSHQGSSKYKGEVTALSGGQVASVGCHKPVGAMSRWLVLVDQCFPASDVLCSYTLGWLRNGPHLSSNFLQEVLTSTGQSWFHRGTALLWNAIPSKPASRRLSPEIALLVFLCHSYWRVENAS